MKHATKTILVIAIATTMAGTAFAASRAQAVRGAMAASDGWTFTQSYEDPALGDQAKGSIH
ncbi:MAG: hypothetical protein HXX10_23870 [Rhodoplanes sp.]|uniref:hypothetical protein n=1 Tax=Rhodoplanes sp. TaxID=1968906 RepID=UPI001847DD4B|nr:hypothetical protein [Rhodoplanes sp.]NVO17074.1 hypothetical protein [Rhodoplanes sp.]